MNQYSHFAIEERDIVRGDTRVDPGDWRLLRRLAIPDRFNDRQGGTIKRALIVDVETTGLSIETDEVIQLAMLAFDYEVESGRILTVHKDDAIDALREPTIEISEEATLITGLTRDMVKGKMIAAKAVQNAVADADVVIAHNAAFDRPILERHWACFADKPWACTLTSIDWLREGFGAGKLDYLGLQFGWFYEGHRALADCEACLALLAMTLPKSGECVMSKVREAALDIDYLVRAVDSPYEERDKLKQRGYRWRPAELPNGRVWWTITKDPDGERAWLEKEIYGGDADIPVQEITALTRFSERLWA
jgi:DNA polymerase-3 subunit epsilon